ncbi:MAG: hypothetical protein JXI33_08030 [Candidatus Aminicenantes bacterium]|nr:hypothetical protein [Candidatus Aminicenantes bacterium]
MKRFLCIVFLLLLLRSPRAANIPAYGKNPNQQGFSETTAPENSDRFMDSEDDIFSTTYERELLSRRIFKKSLPPLSRKETIIWSFKTSKSNTFL